MEHDLEGIPFDLQFAEKQVWGKGLYEEKKKKEEKVENKWEWTHKYWLLKKGSKSLNLALSDVWIFPSCLKLISALKENSKCLFHYFACYRFKNFCLSLPFFVSQYLSPVTTLRLLSWLLCVSICGVWNWYEHMESLVLTSK